MLSLSQFPWRGEKRTPLVFAVRLLPLQLHTPQRPRPQPAPREGISVPSECPCCLPANQKTRWLMVHSCVEEGTGLHQACGFGGRCRCLQNDSHKPGTRSDQLSQSLAPQACCALGMQLLSQGAFQVGARHSSPAPCCEFMPQTSHHLPPRATSGRGEGCSRIWKWATNCFLSRSSIMFF